MIIAIWLCKLIWISEISVFSCIIVILQKIFNIGGNNRWFHCYNQIQPVLFDRNNCLNLEIDYTKRHHNLSDPLFQIEPHSCDDEARVRTSPF